MGRHKGKLCTLALLEPGNIIGLSSLLRAEGCEEVSAATFVEAWSIPDTLIAEVYSIDKGFREWCERNVFLAEGVELVEAILDQSHQSAYGILDVLEKVMPKITSIKPTSDGLRKASNSLSAYIASANCEAELNSTIASNENIPSNNGPFNLRILGLPREVVDNSNKGQAKRARL